MPDCLFCRIIAKEIAAHVIFANDECLAFLDHRPLFPGHCLLVPTQHFETLSDLPLKLVGAFFETAQRLSIAVESAMEAEGTFVAINNRVSQSVPHLHVHIVPRRRKDGLKGFFWPRKKYANDQEMAVVREAIKAAIRQPMVPRT